MMRIWDIDPGYLNRHSLLGEHRELHAIAAILTGNRKGYARHPETLRWRGHGWALAQRHRLLAAEMALRGYREQTPVRTRSGRGRWPSAYIDAPQRQFTLLAGKYQGREPGRIALPRNAQQLWAQHKYSVLARDVTLYRRIGSRVAGGTAERAALAAELVTLLRMPPAASGIRNALQHMWGYVSARYDGNRDGVAGWSPARLLQEIRRLARAADDRYLLASTALGELGAWLPRSPAR